MLWLIMRNRIRGSKIEYNEGRAYEYQGLILIPILISNCKSADYWTQYTYDICFGYKINRFASTDESVRIIQYECAKISLLFYDSSL